MRFNYICVAHIKNISLNSDIRYDMLKYNNKLQ